jgi:hypothetical protein
MHDTTIGEDIFKQTEKTIAECSLHWRELRRVTTDCGGNVCYYDKLKLQAVRSLRMT